MPGPLRAFAEHQPATPIVDTLRSLLPDQPMGSSGVVAAGWLGGAVVVAPPIAALLFRRRTRS
ncbi:hypothetical protein ABGB18_21480 [Nonomuraea sp. B12E4]|uniref:hypothetical protein n=1 Tax=Nonomuraea sp. B12E4 TaxID=3153564 RepID=UPI00325F2E2A